MQNIYRHDGRHQNASVIAAPLDKHDLAGMPDQFTVVHLAPIAGELPSAMLHCLPQATIVGLTAQGLLRKIGRAGNIEASSWAEADKFAKVIDVLVLSDEDIAFDHQAGRHYLRQAPLGVLTRGHLPVQIFTNRGESEIPVQPAIGSQRTGAGDVFAAILFVALARTGDPYKAVQTAATLASCWVRRNTSAAFPNKCELDRALLQLQ